MKKILTLTIVLVLIGAAAFAASTVTLNSTIAEATTKAIQLRHAASSEGVASATAIADTADSSANVDISAAGTHYFGVYNTNKVNFNDDQTACTVVVTPDPYFYLDGDKTTTVDADRHTLNFSGWTAATPGANRVTLTVSQTTAPNDTLNVTYNTGITVADAALGTFNVSWAADDGTLTAGAYSADVVVTYTIN